MLEEPSPPPAATAPRRGRRAIAAAVATGLALMIDAFAIEPRWLEVTAHGDGALTVAHLSDLHITGEGALERRVLDAVSAASPDLIVITGDSVTDGRFDAAPVTRTLSALVAQRPRLGVFAVPGNHEDWVGPGALEAIRAAGVTLLDDRSVTLEGGRLALHGLSRARPGQVQTPGLDIVLCHYPAVLPLVARADVELVLVGHTHGGQVRLPLVGALALPFDSGGFDAGWFERAGTRMYVSRGVGTSILPIRFLCRPEVAIHRLALPPEPAGSR